MRLVLLGCNPEDLLFFREEVKKSERLKEAIVEASGRKGDLGRGEPRIVLRAEIPEQKELWPIVQNFIKSLKKKNPEFLRAKNSGVGA